MKITKFVHSCLLVEMPEPVNRSVLFDPGEMSEEALGAHDFKYLDDIVITHIHPDHFHVPTVKRLVQQFPLVRVLGTEEVVAALGEEGITATTEPPEGMKLFNSPHEDTEPMFPTPQEIGVHHLNMLSHPGDSHSFSETKDILALPVQAPWGATIDGVRLALKLQPKHILPIHDWHWSDAARNGMYARLEDLFKKEGITFHKLATAEPIVID